MKLYNLSPQSGSRLLDLYWELDPVKASIVEDLIHHRRRYRAPDLIDILRPAEIKNNAPTD